jgi:integrase/recombinase XerD
LILIAMLLSEAIEALCIATKANRRSPRTVQGYREKLNYLLLFLGDIPVESITVDDLRRFVASLMDERVMFANHPTRKKRKGTLSPNSVECYVGHVKRLFSWLVDEGYLESDPMARIKRRKAKNREVKAISRNEFLAILATTEGGSAIDKRDRAEILFLADTGCRAGGLCGLKVMDIDLEEGEAEVVEKGDEPRFVFFGEETAQAIRDWLEVRPDDRGDWLFTGLRKSDKDQVNPNSLRLMLDRRARKAGVTGPHRPHSSRHAFAIDYLMGGGDLASLSDLLGHSGVAVTADSYGRFARRQLRQMHARYSRVAQIFGGNRDDKPAD